VAFAAPQTKETDMSDVIEEADGRIKADGCKHQFDNEPYCMPALCNSYHCDDCDVSWSDEWSCARDDECPECGKPISPEESKVIGDCACEDL
jgi:hypothetical protein